MRRYNNNSAACVNSKNVIDSQWDRAIAEAKAQLGELKIRVARLKAAIKVFADNKRREEEAGTAAESAPAKG